ncbi:DUF92 domain-containing protein [Bacillus weihaiensis]|uniref:DUF92 domain-containing protein n=1 Tax=Bacillus weihaiensis TaxID=1547283 RepID=A0A1L3MQ52_9BACI|nr:DUF92 domain-containing protein [Bacillus weihaiensis]APH04384.1 hypothetical protein A9C19_06275 [Bacillus weihaiensis]
MIETIDSLTTVMIPLLAVIAWKVNTLTFGGAIGASVVGIGIYLGFGSEGFIILGCFFVTSTAFGKLKSKEMIEDITEKGDRRDIIQVFANGGIPAILGFLTILFPSAMDILTTGFCVSLGVATSDTWASELGVYSKGKPRMVFTLKEVEKGTSGAISILGTCAGLLGAFFIAILAFLTFDLSFSAIMVITCFSFLGNILDTILGELLQNKYRCRICERVTEKKIHCQQEAEKVRRMTFLTNDMVNITSITLATGMAVLFSS